jgi:hypothetical protein
MQLNLDSDYRLYNLNYTPVTLRYKVEEKLHLGVGEQKYLNIAVLYSSLHTLVRRINQRGSNVLDSCSGSFGFEP